MKPSREEVLRIAEECGFPKEVFDIVSVSSIARFERFAAAMYEAGATDKEARIKELESKLDPYIKAKASGICLGDYLAERAVSDRLLEALKNALGCMELDWSKIDGEWGPTEGGLEGAIQRGEEVEIQKIRAIIAEVEALRKEKE